MVRILRSCLSGCLLILASNGSALSVLFAFPWSADFVKSTIGFFVDSGFQRFCFVDCVCCSMVCCWFC